MIQINPKDLLLDVLFPKVCVGCGKEGKYICDKCNDLDVARLNTTYFAGLIFGD